MALPAGISTATVTAGVPVTFSGLPVRTNITITPSAFLVHTATGHPLVNMIEEATASDGVAVQFTLPVTDQDGFQDEAGNAYKNWYYTATIQYVTDKATKAPFTKVFQLVTGQSIVDLDLLPSGNSAMPYTAPIAGVTSVNGQTGAVAVATTSDSDVAAFVQGSGPTATALSATYVPSAKVGSLQPQPIRDVTTTTIDGATVTPITTFDGYMWGRIGTAIYRSSDSGATWTARGTSPASLIGIIPTPSGEVVAISGVGLYRSTGWATGAPTWTTKATPNGTSQFQPWSLVGNGQKLLTTEYSAGAGFPDSRYVRMSLDQGVTWNIVYDSVAKHGQAAADLSHLHGCAYDPWDGRWYISEGHGTIAGIYCSTDDGATWNRATGMAVLDPSPTVIIPTDDGLVCASDHPKGGLYGVIRRADPMRQELVRTVAWRPGTDGTSGFGVHGARDPETGIVYIGYRTEKAEAAPVLLAGTPTSGAVVYTWPGSFIAYDDIRAVVIPEPGRIQAVVSTQGNTVFSLISARLAKPGAQNASIADTGNSFGGAVSQSSAVAIGPRSTTGTGIRAVAVGVAAEASGTQDSVAVGYGAKATVSAVVAIGPNATASQGNATVVGNSATVTGGNGTAIGNTASAGSSGVAIGHGVTAPSASTVVGASATVPAGSQATAVGNLAQARNSGVGIGHNTIQSGNNATTVGQGTSAAADSTAIGQGAAAAQTSSVALGKGTATNANNQVAIGQRSLMALALAADAPAAPAGGGVLFFKDNGAGKIGLYARFPTGAVVGPIALEP